MNSPFMYMLEEALYENERIFKLAEAVLDGDKLTVAFLVRADDYDKLLTEELKAKVKDIVRGIVPEAFSVEIVYRNAFSSLFSKWCEIDNKGICKFNNIQFFDGKWNYCETFKLTFDDNNNLVNIENIKKG